MVYLLTSANGTALTDLSYSEVREQFYEENVKSFYIEDSVIYMELYEEVDGADEVQSELYSVSIFYTDMAELLTEQQKSGILKEYDYLPEYAAPWWLTFLPYILAIGIFFVLWYVMMNRAGGGGDKGAMKFGKARTRLASEE